MRKGFTLIELIIVILIIGILTSIGFVQYHRITEKSRTMEAKTLLSQIRTAEEAYFLDHETYTGVLSELTLINTAGIPTPLGACLPTHFFSYEITSADQFSFVADAQRCGVGEGGKEPGYGIPGGYCVGIDETGYISVSDPGLW